MAFSDHLDLRTAVVEHVGRPHIVDVFPRLIKLAESRFNRRLRCRDMMANTTLTLTDGAVGLPSGYLEMIALSDSNGEEIIQQPMVVPEYGFRNFYTIANGEILTAMDDEVLGIEYYTEIPTIGDDVTASNWLLAKYPHLYLYGVTFEAAKYINDPEMAQTIQSLLETSHEEVEEDDFKGRYSRARVMVQGVTP